MNQDEQVQAVQLVRADAAPVRIPIDGVQSWVLMGAAGAAVLVLLVGARCAWVRRREDPSARAQRRLSCMLGLTRGDRAILKELSAGGVKPAALLLSHQAFVLAAARVRAAPEAVSALHRKVFGGPREE